MDIPKKRIESPLITFKIDQCWLKEPFSSLMYSSLLRVLTKKTALSRYIFGDANLFCSQL